MIKFKMNIDEFMKKIEYYRAVLANEPMVRDHHQRRARRDQNGTRQQRANSDCRS